MFDDPEILHEEAHSLFRERQLAAAGLVWAKAKAAASARGELPTAFRMGVWEAMIWARQGQLRRSTELLLPLLSSEPTNAPVLERWHARTTAFECQLDLRPDHSKLRRLLVDLEKFAESNEIPQSDLDYLHGLLEQECGNKAASLKHYARGWHRHNEDGYIRSMLGYAAARVSLWNGQVKDAGSWCKKIAKLDQHVWRFTRQALATSRFRMALFANDPLEASKYMDQLVTHRDHGLDLRGWLLSRGHARDSIYDPSDPSHPARNLALLKRVESIHQRYHMLLALVDYRLACIRFTAGLPAVDDLYYRKPDLVSKGITLPDLAKFRLQVHRFDVSWRLLNKLSRYIDGLLECDWRIAEAQSRRERRDAIAAACGEPRMHVP